MKSGKLKKWHEPRPKYLSRGNPYELKLMLLTSTDKLLPDISRDVRFERLRILFSLKVPPNKFSPRYRALRLLIKLEGVGNAPFQSIITQT